MPHQDANPASGALIFKLRHYRPGACLAFFLESCRLFRFAMSPARGALWDRSRYRARVPCGAGGMAIEAGVGPADASTERTRVRTNPSDRTNPTAEQIGRASSRERVGR